MKTGGMVAAGVALVAALYLILSSDLCSSDLFSSDLFSSSSESTESTSGDTLASVNDDSTKSGNDQRSANGKGPVPALAAPIRHGAPPAAKPVRSYELHDGTAVHDHRDKPSEPNLDGYVVLPKTVSKVQPETLTAVRRALRPAMQACIEQHGQGAAEGARIQASITASITEELLRIDKLRVQISGLEEQEDLRSCVSNKVLGHEQVIPGAQDVAAHRMIFPYDL